MTDKERQGMIRIILGVLILCILVSCERKPLEPVPCDHRRNGCFIPENKDCDCK